MFVFIKNLFKKKKSSGELLADYRLHKELTNKKIDDLEREARILKLLQIIGKVKPDVNAKEAPAMLVYCFKELLGYKKQEAIEAATWHIDYILGLNYEAKEDFINQVNKTREYKEYQIEQRKKHIEEDFKDE